MPRVSSAQRIIEESGLSGLKLDRPQSPDDLSTEASKHWVDIVNDKPAGYFGPSTFPLLRRYCELEIEKGNLQKERDKYISERGSVRDRFVKRLDRDLRYINKESQQL